MKTPQVEARTDLFAILCRPVPQRLSPREVQILRACCSPDYQGQKQIADRLGITIGTIKIYYARLYRKLGWSVGEGSIRMLALYGIAHRQMLGIELPTEADFFGIPAVS
jgi:DNA-binding NarL/FixJ family response regulator